MEKKMTVSDHFGSNFEEKIIQAFLGEKYFAEQIVEVLDPELFEKRYTQEIAELLREYFYKYDTVPDMEILEAMIQSSLSKNPIIKKACADFLTKMKDKPLNGDMEYVKENALNYFRTQNIRTVLSDDILPKINVANFEDILPMLKKAIELGSDRNIGYEYNKDEEDRFIEIEENKIKTPWKYVDNLLDGGWGAKRLVTIIGAAGAGKSHMLVNVGVGALMQGKTVIHYPLELDYVEVARRYDACIAGVEINSVPNRKVEVLAKLKKLIPDSANLIIKEYPMMYASTQTIKSHISRLRLKGIEPDIVVVDYGDLLKPISKNGEEPRHNLRAVWQELKALAQELEIPVVTATQTNRSGYDSDVITADQVSEDFSKIMTSDVILTMARNLEQKASGLGKMHMAKNRQGVDGQIFAYKINTAKAEIKVMELTEELEAQMSGEEGKTEEEKRRSKIQNELAQALNGKF